MVVFGQELENEVLFVIGILILIDHDNVVIVSDTAGGFGLHHRAVGSSFSQQFKSHTLTVIEAEGIFAAFFLPDDTAVFSEHFSQMSSNNTGLSEIAFRRGE